MSYKTAYIDIPQLIRKDRKVKTMPKTEEVQKPSKKYAKSRTEHYKDVIIAVLLTAIASFIAGTVYADNRNKVINATINRIESSAITAPEK